MIGTALITGWMQRAGKRQDYERQDAVAKQVAEDRRQADARADEVAKLLVAAQARQAGAADEVARLAAGDNSGSHVAVTLSYPNGNRQSVVLAEVPRVGENVRLSNGADEPWLVVDHVLWVEGTEPPHVIVSVHPIQAAP